MPIHPAAAFLHRKRGARTKIHPPIPPDAIAADYASNIRAMVRFASALTQKNLVAHLDKLGARSDHLDADDAGKIKSVVAEMSKAWHKRFTGPVIARASSAAAAAVNKHSERELFKQIKSGLGIQLETSTDHRMKQRIDDFTKANVELIQTVPEEYFGQVQQVVLDGVANGRRADEIADDLVERAGVAESRADLIASDQVRKFNADLTEARHKDLGIGKYIWRRMPGASKVPREEHIEREGKVYSYDDPPGDDPDDPAEGGNPAEAINCTCWAEPYLDDILASLDE